MSDKTSKGEAKAEIVKFRPKKKLDGRCPICGQASDARLRPFCSRRCADVDLGRWLKGNYAIPTNESPPVEEEDGPSGGSESSQT